MELLAAMRRGVCVNGCGPVGSQLDGHCDNCAGWELDRVGDPCGCEYTPAGRPTWTCGACDPSGSRWWYVG
jgi:hypothetical protein